MRAAAPGAHLPRGFPLQHQVMGRRGAGAARRVPLRVCPCVRRRARPEGRLRLLLKRGLPASPAEGALTLNAPIPGRGNEGQ